MRGKLQVAVVTGGHSFDTIEFHELFHSIPGITPVIQHLDDWCRATAEVRASYDVVVFYNMTMTGPADEGIPWFAGKQITALSELGRAGQGIFVLHHAILAFPDWKPWDEMVGIDGRKFGYHWKGPVKTEVADTTHPITRGLPASWELGDESYTMNEPAGPDVRVLLTTKHEPSMRAIAWTNRYKESRVFCYQSGHGAPVYRDPNFRAVISRGIQWVARDAAEVPPTMPVIAFTAKGVTAIVREPTPVATPGTVLVRSLYSGVTNGTERNVLMGQNYNAAQKYPISYGYQNVGEVIEVGVAAEGTYAVGDVVYSGAGQALEHYHKAYFTLPATPHRLIAKLPPGIDPMHAALFGVASVGFNNTRRGAVSVGERVLVVGAGLIGQFAAQAARAAGAIVTVVDRDARRLETARSLGADQTVDVTDGWSGVAAHGPFDVVLETSGAPRILDAILGTGWGAGRVITWGARVVLVAGRDQVEYSYNAGQGSGVSILHVSHFGPEHLVNVIRLVGKGVIRVGPLIQDIIPIADAVAFYDRLRDNPASTFGTVIDWRNA